MFLIEGKLVNNWPVERVPLKICNSENSTAPPAHKLHPTYKTIGNIDGLLQQFKWSSCPGRGTILDRTLIILGSTSSCGAMPFTKKYWQQLSSVRNCGLMSCEEDVTVSRFQLLKLEMDPSLRNKYRCAGPVIGDRPLVISVHWYGEQLPFSAVKC